MPRPCKRRRICAMPGCGRFGPRGGCGRGRVVMTLDEFESIRLIDLEGMTQEQCAAQMQVARTTAQAVYGAARRKLAECLVRGSELLIAGGDYELCGGAAPDCPGRCRCGRRTEDHNGQTSDGRSTAMTIAVTYENGQVFQHFGHTEQFRLYEVADGKVVSARTVDTAGSGHGALAALLRELGADTLICGGIGGGAQQALTEAGIRFYGGVTGEADRAVADLLAGKLGYDPNARCEHHDGEAHTCGEHDSCGEHDGCAYHC